MPPRFRLSPLSAALLPLFFCTLAQADTLPAGSLRVEADKIDGQMNQVLKAEGQVRAERDGQTFEADWLEYYVDKQYVRAGQRAVMRQAGSTVEGDNLESYLDQDTGSADNAAFSFKDNGRTLRGNAERLTMQGKGKYQLQGSRANTCDPNDDSWYLKAGTIDLDYGRNIGVARHARVEFQGVPILYTPWIDFPLDGNRKSGLLFPTVKTGSDGLQLAVPYYWNIAPNYDATITPTYMEQRGTMLGLEGRYLQADYQGKLSTEQLDDRQLGKKRHLWQFSHQQTINPALGFSLNGTTVSDSDYFKDFGDRNSAAANVNLERVATLSYNPGWASFTVKAQRYQTLQDSTGSVDEPYARLPQIIATSSQQLGSLRVNLESELTRFSHGKKQEGVRSVLYPSVSWALEQPWGFVRPKLGLHYTQYQLDSYGSQAARTLNRSLPVTSVDSGLVFEREDSLHGRSMTQTLEPRLYYVYIPSKDQSALPNFDTSENDFNFAQLFTENRFSGYDRINAANQVTAAVTSRMLDKENGQERLRLAIGQRFYLNKRDTSLSGSTTQRSQGGSDLLLTLGSDLTQAWRMDGSYQYNQTLSKTERYNIQLRYNPAAGKTLSVRYRYGRDEIVGSSTQRDALRQVDIAGQWPLAQRWYAVARQNYSLRDRKPLEQLLGLEYNQGCWSTRLVGQRYVTDLTKTKNAVFLQLELKDLSSLGSNPMDTLRLAIPGYSKINETADTQ
ncbi:MAG: LPS-assembly protein LptD [Vogesella sp.]|uniref:LPS-assembly protein LptD n=1 Tax=Vogesella sp. TaxID=1904252 RepID=UPI0039199B01